MFILSTVFVTLFIFYVILYYIRVLRILKTVPNPPIYPLFGNALMLLRCKPKGILTLCNNLVYKYGPRLKLLVGSHPIVILSDPEDFEVVLSQNDFNAKSEEYTFLQPWLGLGLVTNSGKKWRKRRKVITPSFHFKILENFLEIFDKQCNTLMEKLKTKCDDKSFDIYQYITLYALDVICETSMGTSINAQMNSESEYVKAVKGVCQIVFSRMRHIWKRNNFLFKFSEDFSRQQKYLKVLHGFTDEVIQQRRLILNNNDHILESYSEDLENGYGGKRKLAFLDLLLMSTIDGVPLSDLDIREEVDTFLFEGHDTVSSAIGLAVYELSKNPEIQNKIFEEQNQVFPDKECCVSSYNKLQEMKYLEMVIKETLRLYPSVPMLARTVHTDVTLRDLTIPKNTSIVLYLPKAHTNPNYFPDPDKFIPERFSIEESNKRNPFSAVFFSAGPRNCIGQKFAMMELKLTLSKIVRNFIIEPSGEDVVLLGDLILKPMTGIKVKLKSR